jgi:hypothetical protein
MEDCSAGSRALRYGIGEPRTDGPVFDPADTSLLDHDLRGRDLRRRLGGLHIARHSSTELSMPAHLQSGGAEALRDLLVSEQLPA